MLKIKNILCVFIFLFTILEPIYTLNTNNTIINTRRLNSANYFTSDTVSEISYTSYNISSDSYESDDSKDISNCVPFIEKSSKSSSSSDDKININRVQINRDRKAYEMFTRKCRLMDIENQTKLSLSDLVDVYVKKN